MKQKISKTEAKIKINYFFKDIKNKNSKDVKKIKRLAMSHKIPLKEKRKLFCKKCLTPYTTTSKVRIKNRMKSVVCESCENVNRWRMK